MMVKESIFFVVSAGLLIYFITSSDEPVETIRAPQVEQPVVVKAAPSSATSWSYEEAEDDGKPFVFGEPLTDLGGDYDDPVPMETAKSGPPPIEEVGSDGAIRIRPKPSPHRIDR